MAEHSDSELSQSAAFTLEACNTFYDTILTFDSSHPCVRVLSQELEGLSEMVDALDRIVHDTGDSKIPLHPLPLRQCGRACVAFEQELLKHSSQRQGDGITFRHWKKLRYNGSGIEGFTQLLMAYKLTVKVALLHASLCEPSLTAEELDGYRSLVQTAVNHLRACLEDADISRETLLEQTMKEHDHKIELENMTQERTALQSCIQTCERLSKYLAQIRPIPEHSVIPTKHSQETISVIVNHGTGDVFQIMVSADGTILHGTNRSLGWNGRQCGGHLSNFTTRQISHDMSRTRFHHASEGSRSPGNSVEDRRALDFQKRWGPGFVQETKGGARMAL